MLEGIGPDMELEPRLRCSTFENIQDYQLIGQRADYCPDIRI